MSDDRTPQISTLDRFFHITERGSSVGREVRGGVATFFTMAYIVVLNPLIIATAPDAEGQFIGDGSGANIPLVAAGTALVAGLLSILMGVVGKVPFAMAAGLGLNAFVTYNIAPKMSWESAMGLVFLEGVVIALLVLTGFRTAVFNAIPSELKTAISVGIGLFIALIGFVDAGFVRRVAAGPPLELGIRGALTSWPIFVFVAGLLLITVLVARRVKGAILIGIVATTVLAIVVEAVGKIGAATVPGRPANPAGWQLVVPGIPDRIFGFTNPLVLFREFDPFGAFGSISALLALLLVFSLLITDFFDTMGTIVGVGGQAGLIREDGTLPGPARSCSSTRSARRPAAPPPSPPTRPTSSRPRASAKARAPASPASSPACCSCSPSSSHRSSPSSRTRPPPPRSSSSAS